jgi:hypothetical protein
MKQICPIHHFSYSGNKCPFCEDERLENLAKKFVVIDHFNVLGNYKHKTNNDIEITEEHLKKLTEKFNVKKK